MALSNNLSRCAFLLCLHGSEGQWIIETMVVKPQSVALGWLWSSLAEQTENSRSVLAAWLKLCEATSSLAGTDRCVTSLIRTQLHRHIKDFPLKTRSWITILGIFQHLLHPQNLHICLCGSARRQSQSFGVIFRSVLLRSRDGTD